jgi:hypothetical protein
MRWEAHVQQDTPEVDKARLIAENVYYALRGQGTTLVDPSEEQTLIRRLVEAVRPEVGTSVDAIISAANSVRSAWEENSDEAPGPRVKSVNLTDGSVAMELR